MRVSRYEIFMKVVTLGSLTKAATYFNYSQSSISQTIKSLEDEFQMALIYRSHSGAVLTEDGKRLIPFIRNIVDSQAMLRSEVNSLNGLITGNIRIAAFSSVSCHWLPTLIKSYKQKYPGITFEILQGSYEEIINWVCNGYAELGFITGTHNKGLDLIPMYKDPMVAIVPDDSPLAENETVSIDELLAYPFIYLTEGEEELYQRILKSSSIKANISYFVKDDYSVMAMVENQLGVSILPELVAKRTCYHIRCIPLVSGQYRYISVAMNDRTKLTVASKYFLQMMRENLSKSRP